MIQSIFWAGIGFTIGFGLGVLAANRAKEDKK